MKKPKRISYHFFIYSVGLFLFLSIANAQGNFWIQVSSGLTDTSILSLAIDSSDHIFAGTWAEGVFRSTNDGNQWLQTTLTYPTVTCITINPSGHIFAGTATGGVFRSTNRGDSWTQINTGLTDYTIRTLAINSSGHIFAGNDAGIFRSIDNGGT